MVRVAAGSLLTWDARRSNVYPREVDIARLLNATPQKSFGLREAMIHAHR
jgi:hypothetical protein